MTQMEQNVIKAHTRMVDEAIKQTVSKMRFHAARCMECGKIEGHYIGCKESHN